MSELEEARPRAVAAHLQAAQRYSMQRNGFTPLHYAACCCFYMPTECFVRAEGRAVGGCGETCTSAAVCRLLVEQGAEVDAVAADGRTPLEWAVRRSSCPAVVRALCTAGASVARIDDLGNTILHWALGVEGLRHPDAVDSLRILLDAGADPTARRCMGDSALHDAVVTLDVASAAVLIQAHQRVGASIDGGGDTPLLRLVESIPRLLRNAVLMARTNGEQSAAIAACRRLCVDMCKLLIWNGASVHARDKGGKGCTPLEGLTWLRQSATVAGPDPELCALLIDEGASAVNCQAGTPEMALVIAGAGSPVAWPRWCHVDNAHTFLKAIADGGWRRRVDALVSWLALQQIIPGLWHPFQ